MIVTTSLIPASLRPASKIRAHRAADLERDALDVAVPPRMAGSVRAWGVLRFADKSRQVQDS
jgi:hypothetical protein